MTWCGSAQCIKHYNQLISRGVALHTGVGGGTQFTRVSPGASKRAATGSSGHTHSNLCTAGDSSISTGENIQKAVANTGIWERHMFTYEYMEFLLLFYRTNFENEKKLWLDFFAIKYFNSYIVIGSVWEDSASSFGFIFTILCNALILLLVLELDDLYLIT